MVDVYVTHEQDGCPRQEKAHSRAKKKQKVSSLSLGYAICANAQEPGEPSIYMFQLDDAPGHMKRRLQMQARDNNKRTYEFLHDDGPDALDGLVNRDSEYGDESAAEILAYLESKCCSDNIMELPFNGSINFTFTLAQA
jgi:hypothetical protein